MRPARSLACDFGATKGRPLLRHIPRDARTASSHPLADATSTSRHAPHTSTATDCMYTPHPAIDLLKQLQTRCRANFTATVQCYRGSQKSLRVATSESMELRAKNFARHSERYQYASNGTPNGRFDGHRPWKEEAESCARDRTTNAALKQNVTFWRRRRWRRQRSWRRRRRRWQKG